MIWLLSVLVVVLGLPLGWACAWLVHRYQDDPETETAVLADAVCDRCSSALTATSTLPRGACPECGTRLPATWFVTTLAVPLAGLVMVVTWHEQPVVLPAFLWLVPVAVVASMVDVRLMLIPKRVVWVGLGVGAALVVATTLVVEATDARGPGIDSVPDAAVGAAVYFGLLYLMWFLVPRGMGYGDVRFASVLGLYLGWIDLTLTFYGLLVGALIGVVIGVIARIVRSDKFFPFGPGMALGALVVIAFWEQLVA